MSIGTVVRPWKRGTAAQRAANTVVPAGGEIGVETDTGRLVVSDGVTQWKNLPAVARANDCVPIGSTPPSLLGQVPGYDPDVSDNPAKIRWFTSQEHVARALNWFIVTDTRWAGGAKGDGVTDDAAAFQACFTAAIAAHGTIFIPAPAVTYNIGTTITGSPAAGDGGQMYVNIEASGKHTAVSWVGAANQPVFRMYGWKRSYARGVKIRNANSSAGMIGWDLDCVGSQGSLAQITWYDCTVSSPAVNNWIGWRMGHTNTNNAEFSFLCWINSHVTQDAASPGCGSIGWVNEAPNGLQMTWQNGSSLYMDRIFTNVSTSGAANAFGGGSMYFDGLTDTTTTTACFTIANQGNYFIKGRYELGSRFLDVQLGGGSTGPVIVLDGPLISGFTPSDGCLIHHDGAAQIIGDGLNIVGYSRSDTITWLTSTTFTDVKAVASDVGGMVYNGVGGTIPAGVTVASVVGTTVTVTGGTIPNTVTGLVIGQADYDSRMISIAGNTGTAYGNISIRNSLIQATAGKTPFWSYTGSATVTKVDVQSATYIQNDKKVKSPFPFSGVKPFGPVDQALAGWSFDPAVIVGSSLPSAGGRPVYVRVKALDTKSITQLFLLVTTAGATLTTSQNYMALLDSTGAVLAVSADMSTLWTGTGRIAATISSTQVIAGNYYYIAFVVNGTTAPTLGRGFSGTVNPGNIGDASAPYRYSQGASTGVTSLASAVTLTGLQECAVAYWTGMK